MQPERREWRRLVQQYRMGQTPEYGDRREPAVGERRQEYWRQVYTPKDVIIRKRIVNRWQNA
jgi:hypothetical protein